MIYGISMKSEYLVLNGGKFNQKVKSEHKIIVFVFVKSIYTLK